MSREPEASQAPSSSSNQGSKRILFLNTLAFAVCFAAWMINGVLVTFLSDNRLYDWDSTKIGLLIGIPVLTGALGRFPVGILADKYGGRKIFTFLMLFAAIPMFFLSKADSYPEFLLASLGFGLAGASFAVGVAYTSAWFSKENQGLALGIFGVGNAGAALTSLLAPGMLNYLTLSGANLEGWRMLPRLYALCLALTAIIFYLFTYEKKREGEGRSILQTLSPLQSLRVWRFGFYYFILFGGFVAITQWLIPYYVAVYAMSLAGAGLLAAIFSLSSSITRAAGGWISDKVGARTALYWVFSASIVFCAMLTFPRMEVRTPGMGVLAKKSGTVASVTREEIVVDNVSYRLHPENKEQENVSEYIKKNILVWPVFQQWQIPVVSRGDHVKRGEPLAKGTTSIFFQANVWIFTGILALLGTAWGVGMAAVFKYIPAYFPKEVGIVGGVVGVLGGLGGFVCPILFGYLLKVFGIWTTCWLFFLVLSAAAFFWLRLIVRSLMRSREAEWTGVQGNTEENE